MRSGGESLGGHDAKEVNPRGWGQRAKAATQDCSESQQPATNPNRAVRAPRPQSPHPPSKMIRSKQLVHKLLRLSTLLAE